MESRRRQFYKKQEPQATVLLKLKLADDRSIKDKNGRKRFYKN